MTTLSGFRRELEGLINAHSRENGSNTPDFILAEFLTDCLASFDKAVNERTSWYGGETRMAAPGPPPQGSPVQPGTAEADADPRNPNAAPIRSASIS